MEAEVEVEGLYARHAAYVQSWVRVLKDDKKEIFKASNEAVQIADYAKRFMPERFKEKDETLVSTPEGVIVDAEPQVPATEETPVQPTEEVQSIGDHLTPVDDPSLRTLPLSAQAKETARLYRYFVERVTSLVGSIPTDNLHSIEKHAADAPYKGGDAIYFYGSSLFSMESCIKHMFCFMQDFKNFVRFYGNEISNFNLPHPK